MSGVASQITSVPIACSTVGSNADHRKHQRSASLAFVWGIHRWPVNSPHKRPVTRKMFPFDDVIVMIWHIGDPCFRQVRQYNALTWRNRMINISKILTVDPYEDEMSNIFYWHLFPRVLDNMSALVRATAWRRIGNKPLPDSILAKINGVIWRHLASST